MQLDDLEDKHDELHNMNEQMKKAYKQFEWTLKKEEEAVAERDADVSSAADLEKIKDRRLKAE